MPKIEPTIVIDTREQEPFNFLHLPTTRGTLTTGDYSVAGLERLVAVERKSLSDFLGCLGHGRERFERELQRLMAYRERAVIIETSADEIERGEWRSQLKPSHVEGALASWPGKYRMPFYLVGTHARGSRYCERFLYRAALRILEQFEAAAALVQQAQEQKANEN